MSLPPLRDIPTGLEAGLRGFVESVRDWIRVGSGQGKNTSDRLVAVADLVGAGLVTVKGDGSLAPAGAITLPTAGPPTQYSADGVIATDKSGNAWLRTGGRWRQITLT